MDSGTSEFAEGGHKSQAPDDAATSGGIITSRALVLGTLGAVAIGLGGPWVDHVIRGSYMTLDFSTPGAIFLLFMCVAIPQMALYKFAPRYRFTVAEMVTIYSMMIVASAICTGGLTALLIPMPTAAFYYASLENKYATLLTPHIPSWLVPSGADVKAPVIRYLYEGLPLGRSVPWANWLPMLLAWAPMLLALYLVMIATMVIIRRQWVENEHLTYPLTQLPLALIGEQERGFPKLLTNRLFWGGFCLPVVLGTLRGLHAYFPSVPVLNQMMAFPVFRQQLSFHVELSWALLGFFYLVTTECSFSLWFMNRVFFLLKGVLAILGIAGTENMGIAGGSKDPYFIHLGVGAFIAMVGSNVWVGRGHLKHVWQCAVDSYQKDDYDASEIMSFRSAVWVTGGSLLFMAWWLMQSGMPLSAVLLALVLGLILFIGIVRVVIEVGFASVEAPKPVTNVVISWLGSSYLGPRGVVATGLTYVWGSTTRSFVMCMVANSLKTAQTVRGKQHRLFWAFLIAIVVAMVSSIWLTLLRAYTQGGITMNNWYFNAGPNYVYTYLAAKIQNPSGPAWYGMGLAAVGAAIYYLMAVLRCRYLQWPLHPVAFAVGHVWMMDSIWFTAFLAWALKGLILRYGGNKLYLNLRPAFLGVVCGQFVINGLWLVVDQITGKTGNIIFWI